MKSCVKKEMVDGKEEPLGIFEVDADNVRDAVARWNPDAGASESVFELQLYNFLHTSFPAAVFQRQYAKGRTRADIYVEFRDGAHVAVEVKCNLNQRGDYHRLLGQTYEYLTEWKAEVVVVLCGETETSVAKLVEQYIELISAATSRKAHVVVVKAHT